MSFLKWIGLGGSKSHEHGSDWLENTTERYFGLENCGNTCYCNSVLQALYFCKPFRDCIQNYVYPSSPALLVAKAENIPIPANSASPLAGIKFPSGSPSGHKKNPSLSDSSSPAAPGSPDLLSKHRRASSGRIFTTLKPEKPASNTPEGKLYNILYSTENSNAEEETMLSSLRDLFKVILGQKKKSGVINPYLFVNKLKKENELFRSTMHQDAHEFLNFLINAIAEILVGHQKELADALFKSPPDGTPVSPSKSSLPHADPKSWVHELFEGILINETKCLTCETITSRDEAFLDLSVDIEQHTSLSSCLQNFSSSEILCSKNKFYCDHCCGLQEAEKRMKIKKLPNVLAVHLKRFKYQEKLQRYVKLSHRVVFPMELRLFNTADEAENAERLYSLCGVVVHIGNGPYHGHYIALVKSDEQWVLFDDENVEPVDENELQKFFGDNSGPGSGYIFFYQATDFDYTSTLSKMSLHPITSLTTPSFADTDNPITVSAIPQSAKPKASDGSGHSIEETNGDTPDTPKKRKKDRKGSFFDPDENQPGFLSLFAKR